MKTMIEAPKRNMEKRNNVDQIYKTYKRKNYNSSKPKVKSSKK